MGPLHGSTMTYSTFIPIPPPSQYLQTIAITSGHLPSSAVPFTSSHPRSHSDFAGFIGLIDLYLRGTSSSASDSPTLVYPPALDPQLEDSDVYRRRYYSIWSRNSEEYQVLSEKGKKVKASSKGGSLYTAGAAKKLGRKPGQDEVFEENHVKKKKDPTDEDVWVEPRAKATHDKYMQLVNEFPGTQFPKSQGDTIPEDVEELWKETVGPPVRGQYYGYHKKCFSDNVRILPPCPGDARATKGLGPLDDITTDEESDLVYAAEDGDDEDDDER
ncbi:hypothetical protein FXO38_27026 [Capsicum annuum]|nr:hypothetical protein FXO38_27026 [Capsicum annuum]